MKSVLYTLLSVLLIGCADSKSNKQQEKGKLESKVVRGGSIWSMDWSPDGKFIACGNASGLLRIYNAENLQLSNILTGFKSTINGIHWSPDGNKIVASGGHEDPKVIIWDLEAQSRMIIDVHERQVRSVRWSPKGKHFASTSHDGTIRIWTREGTFVTMFEGANGGCVGIDWLDEDKIAASCWDNTIRIYTISNTDSLLIENGNHRQKAVLTVDWHPNGKLIATGDMGNEGDTIHAVKLWTDKGNLIWEATSHQKEIRSLSWNPDGSILATGGESVRLWNQEGDLLDVFKESTSPIWSLDWNEDGTQIATGHNDGKIRVWNVEGGLLRLLDGHSTVLISSNYNSDSTQVLLGFADGTLRLIDLNQLSSQTVAAHSRSVRTIERSPDQSKVFLNSNDGTCSIWNIEHGTLKKMVVFGKDISVKTSAWNDDNQMIAMLDNNNKISVWSIMGEFEYALELNNEKVNTITWQNGKPIGIVKVDNQQSPSSKIFAMKDQRKLELIPLNKNRFALVDSLNNIVYGDKNDFIKMVSLDTGFTEIKPVY